MRLPGRISSWSCPCYRAETRTSSCRASPDVSRTRPDFVARRQANASFGARAPSAVQPAPPASLVDSLAGHAPSGVRLTNRHRADGGSGALGARENAESQGLSTEKCAAENPLDPAWKASKDGNVRSTNLATGNRKRSLYAAAGSTGIAGGAEPAAAAAAAGPAVAGYLKLNEIQGSR